MGLLSNLKQLKRAARYKVKYGELGAKNPLPELHENPFDSAFKACREPENYRLRLWHECKMAELTEAVEGAWLFVGVSHGRSAHCCLRYLGDRARERRLILLDNWDGAGGNGTGDHADYCRDFEATRKSFGYHEATTFVRGLAPAALSDLNRQALALVVFDTAVVAADVKSLPLVWPLVSTGGAVLLNRAYRQPLEMERYREAITSLPSAAVLPLLTGSVVIFKLGNRIKDLGVA